MKIFEIEPWFLIKFPLELFEKLVKNQSFDVKTLAWNVERDADEKLLYISNTIFL